jgi:serine/threonine protein kinase
MCVRLQLRHTRWYGHLSPIQSDWRSARRSVDDQPATRAPGEIMPARDHFRTEDEDTRLARARLGTLLLDKWRIDELLGVGGMAAVYAATHRQGKRVAIKMLHAKLAHSTEIQRRFIDEGYIGNHVGHSGVVSILDDDVAEDGAAFLVMDLLEGEALDELLERRGRLDPLELLSLIDELLDVLAAAHAQGIVHRDVKPGNIFVTRDNRIKLLDFGVAQQSEPWRRSHVTPCGSAIGTPAFMAPEQARGRVDEVDARSDLWAVGATMFTALSGRQVHEADTYNEQMLCAMTQRARSLAFVAPDLPSLLVDFVDRTLACEPDRRWPSATGMQAALREVHAVLIEEQTHLEADGDPQVSLEEFTGGLASESPVTISAELRFARSNRRDAKTLVARRSNHRGALWSAIAITLLVTNVIVWIQWQRQLASRSIVVETLRPTSPAATGMFPASTEAVPIRDLESADHGVDGVEDADRTLERHDRKGSAASEPAQTPQSVPVRVKASRHGVPRSGRAPVPQSLPDSKASSSSPEPPMTAIDPLERRR